MPTTIGGAEILGGVTGPLERSVPIPHQFLSELEKAVSAKLDLPMLMSIATSAPSLTLEGREQPSLSRKCRIAVTDDPCFQSCFQDNIDILRRNGAEIASFSPLADTSIPRNIGGIYVTGANLRDYAADISANKGLRKSIRDFFERGGVIYSEAGGSAFLAESFTCGEDPQTHEGVGVLPIHVTIKDSAEWKYNEAVTIEDSIIGPPGLIVKGVDTHEFETTKGQRVLTALRASPYGATYLHEGLSPGAQVLSTFFYLHWGSNPAIGQHVAEAANVFAQSQVAKG